MRSSWLTLLLAACGCGSAPPPSSHVTSVVDYEVHEWGLVRAEANDALRVGAMAPPIDHAPLVVLKPVLYFHSDAPITIASVTVDAGEGGAIVETWPSVGEGARVTWSSVEIDPRGPCSLSVLPGIGDPICTRLGGDFCEVASLASARADDAACVTSGGITDRFLFYRSRTTSLTLPLSFERTGGEGRGPGEIRVTNEGDAEIPGTLVRILVTSDATSVHVVAPPAPHASIVVSVPTSPGASDGQMSTGPDAVRATLGEIGLSPDEIDAFSRSWDGTLFGPLDAVVTLAPPVPIDSFVYFLPASATDGVATLVFDPPPRTVRRAIAVWSRVPESGVSH